MRANCCCPAHHLVCTVPPAPLTSAISIHREDLPGDILVFLTGQDECEAAVRMLEEENRRLR